MIGGRFQELRPGNESIAGHRALGVILAGYLALATFQTGRDVERPGDPKVAFGDPVSWVAAPAANFLENTGIVDTPENK